MDKSVNIDFVSLVNTLVLENLVTLITLNIFLTMLYLHVVYERLCRVGLSTNLTNFSLGSHLLFLLLIVDLHVAFQIRLGVEHYSANLTGEFLLLVVSLVISDCTLGGEVFLAKAAFITLVIQVHVVYVVIQMAVVKKLLVTHVTLLRNLIVIL